jgi:hypothetical protein
MILTVGFSCGHGLRLLDACEVPPADDPWAMYPLIQEHPLELGDAMTCIICHQTRTVIGVYDATPIITSDGKLRLP